MALASAFLGFSLVKSSSMFAYATNTNTNTPFGSPEDIEKAIHELRTVLGEAQVSTDPGDLQVQGSNDHHQGSFFPFNQTLSEMCIRDGS